MIPISPVIEHLLLVLSENEKEAKDLYVLDNITALRWQLREAKEEAKILEEKTHD